MKNKTIIVSAIVGGLLLSTLIIFAVTGRKHHFKRVNPAFKEYVQAFTSGVVSTHTTIKVRLNQDFADSALFNTPIDKKLFDFSPNISGKAYWADSRTVEFRPDKPLPPKKFYDVKFYLSKLMKVPDSLATMEFQFQTMQQDFELKVDNHKAYSKNDRTREKMYGSILTADVANEKDIELLLTAEQESKNLHITWTHDAKNRVHYFLIDSVKRGNTTSYVSLNFNGSTIGVKKKGTKDVEIPSLGVFKLIDVRVVNDNENYIAAFFSDPLLENQNLEGLIRYARTMDLRYMIEDNELKIYPAAKSTGNSNLEIDPAIKNTDGRALGKTVSEAIPIEEAKPNVRFLGNGVIMPTSNGMLLPFEAVNLKAVDVKVIKIYENNILQFLQVNDLAGSSELTRVGRTVLKKTVSLTKVADYNKWNRFSLDLADLIKAEPGAIYQVKLSFKKAYSTYNCPDSTMEAENDNELTTWNDVNERDEDGWYYENRYYDSYYDEEGYYDYDWSERDNPCNRTYYNDKHVTRNVLASDLGIVAKAGSMGNYYVYVTDIVTTKPQENVTLEFYDYQQQLLLSTVTNDEGKAEVKLKRRPFVVVAKKDKQRGYLKLIEGSSLSLSMFDVSGDKIQKGIKGFIYGERGVWRPGDSLYLTFILEDKEKMLPDNHPVTFDLTNPNGQIVKRMVKTTSVNGFYDFRTATDRTAPTGNWKAKVKVGGIEFEKNIKIETIKPNRLKINIGFGKEYIAKDEGTKGNLQVSWLTGAIAKNLKATVNLTLMKSVTEFKKYPGYTFDNPTTGFAPEVINIFTGKVDENGKAVITPNINITHSAPGILKANFETTVYENGGDFSVDRFTIPYYPFKSYIGFSIPYNNKTDRMLYTDKQYNISLVNVDYNGNPYLNNTIKVYVYKLNWSWWWDNSESSSQADFISTSYHQVIDSATVTTSGGKAFYKFKVEHNDWGRYFIKFTDEKSGHSAGKIVYVDWYGYYRNPDGDKSSAAMLTFSADKEKYNVGETAKITVPTSVDGRILLTLETGTKVLKSMWVPTNANKTEFTFDITADMAPNCYAYCTLIQPHSQAVNDLPIRLYGVIPIMVEDPNTHLKPKIIMKDVLEPEKVANITVREEKGKAMTYTLAIVDEGLLDLTRFKTPDPWLTFYAKEALGVKTWDLFDMVMGAYSGELSRILSIGGDGDGKLKGSMKANRFKPIVKFIGPFELKAGQSKTHTFMMPQYIGSVRVMVVAGDKGKYGCAEKAVAVRKPLMVLGTLPRVVGPGETVKLPVSVFAMEKNVKNVSVKIVADNMFSVSGSTSQKLTFNRPGDDIVNFELKVKDVFGVGKIKIIATSGTLTAVHDLEIDIRNPNPRMTDVVESTIQPGRNWDASFKLIGMQGTNKGVLEISSIPSLNLEKRIGYLIEYPHGCIEQTTSSVFPQLYLNDILDLSQYNKSRINQNISAAIQRLKSFQVSNGGLSYWPGDQYADDWGTNYAGHFMLEAELKGYALPVGFIVAWKKFQKQKAITWTYNANYYNNDLIQAYRLYTLALAKVPEMGAMNKLYEYGGLSLAARWRLAAAYQLAGKPEIARKLTTNLSYFIKPYREMWFTYGSDVRDKAMIIETLSLMNMKTNAAPLINELSAQMCKEEWMSTQTTAYCLLAVSKYIGSTSGKGINASYKLDNGQLVVLQSTKSIAKIDLSIKANSSKGKIQIINNGKNLLYARVVTSGIPLTGDKSSSQNNLRMTVDYKSMAGAKIDPKKLEQGVNFMVEVTVDNPGFRGVYKQMALTQIFPSGWEIFNTRMSDFAKASTDAKSKEKDKEDDSEDNESSYSRRHKAVQNTNIFNYQDIRDDRVYTYFDLNPNQTKTFKIMLNSSYLGKFYLPTVYCEAMYDNTVNARIAGTWVEVVASAK
ncbi:MAG: MG2 domain-containing protein [Bacteroidota bacterium]